MVTDTEDLGGCVEHHSYNFIHYNGIVVTPSNMFVLELKLNMFSIVYILPLLAVFYVRVISGNT